MTDPIPPYESEGPLTVCPCCGEPPAPIDSSGSSKSCARCWHLVRYDEYVAGTRATMAEHGVRLRREGKLPPLKEPERWGVWANHADGWCVISLTGSLSRSEADTYADKFRKSAKSWESYTVKPYPDAKQTPFLPPYDCGVHPPEEACACRGRAIAEPAKVDPYARHRLAGERRRAEATTQLGHARRFYEEALASVARHKASIDRLESELARLDRTGEVK